MKKLFIWVAAVALCVSCSQEEVTAPPSGGDSGLIADGEAKHLTVNIIAAGENGTRATGDPNNAAYEDGSAKENKVSAVRFYFYDDNDAPANVKADGTNTLYWENPGVSAGEAPNVEKILQAKLIISTKAGDKLPTKVVAVLNPGIVGLGETVTATKGLDDIRKNLRDYAGDANKATGSDNEAGQFAMINSAYADDSKVEYFATEIKPQNYAPNAVAAETDPKPVEIYVERATAKVRVQLNPELVTEDGYIALKNKEGEPINVHINGVPSQIYLKLSSNWNLTAATDKGSLGKYIDATWATDYLGAQRWTYAPYFRSYWAKNPAEGVKQTWSSYNDLFGANAGTQYSTTANKYEQYTNENAPQSKNVKAISGADVEPFTKVIMAGELCYKTGDSYEVLPLGKFLGAKYVGEDDLIVAMLEYLQKSGSMIYSYEESPSTGTSVAFTGIEETDVELLTALETIKGGVTISDLDPSEKTTGRYNVYLQLSETGKGKSWTKSDKESDYKAADQILANPTDVNQYLANALGGAQMYTSGNTYYFFPIRHLGDNTGGQVGYYGVVRNHIYDCTINSIAGLGTPVYDPDEVIYPEIPQEDETFIAAKINILSWRIVSNDVDLEWE